MPAEGNVNSAIRILCVPVFCLVISSGVWAQEAPTPVDETTLVISDAAAEPGTSVASTSILPYIFRMVLVLGFVIAAIYGLYALIRRSSRPKPMSDSPLKILATNQVGPGRSLLVASVGTKAWLLGSTDAALSLIAEIQDKELIDELTLNAQKSPDVPRQDFSTVLSSLLKPRAGGTSRQGRSSDFYAKQRDRLKKF